VLRDLRHWHASLGHPDGRGVAEGLRTGTFEASALCRAGEAFLMLLSGLTAHSMTWLLSRAQYASVTWICRGRPEQSGSDRSCPFYCVELLRVRLCALNPVKAIRIGSAPSSAKFDVRA
jgi:hypothetical protein